MASLDFKDRVAVVTGAGAGLGRSYALLFASRGAKVVVNDLGSGRHGEGQQSAAADSVVAEIRKNGGIAVADYNSVVDGEKVIKTALDNFGRVDIVVNNAGILRDRSFARISDQDWDLIHAVHLKGSFKVTQAAWPIFRKQNYGRIIMTSSNAGIYGNFGQANYSAAKLGLVGLANTLAIEGQKYNIHCNVIVPTAASRLTEDILPPDLFKELKPEYIAPVVAYLCHESCDANGEIIESAIGWVGKLHYIRSQGKLLRTSNSPTFTIEDVQANWSQAMDMSKAKHLDNIQEATAALVDSINNNGSSDSGASGDDSNLFKIDNNKLILYSLAVGATVTKPAHLSYLYENHENFQPAPGFFILPGLMTIMTSSVTADALPHADVSPTNILHGEQYLEVVGKLPTEGQVRTEVSVADVLDKGSGAVVIVDFSTYNGDEVIVKGQMMAFCVGAGNFGGPRNSAKAIAPVPPPKRQPDAVIEEKTSEDAAALYRLCGDLNPLHIDSNIAQMAGYKKPILHGLCTVGYSVRHVLDQYADSDGSLFKSYKVRFSKPVLPGQTLRTLMWREGNRIHFSTQIKETGAEVVTGAYVDLKEVKMTASTKLVSAPSLESDAIFQKIIDGVKEDPAKAKSVNGIFLYEITKDGKKVKEWTLDLKKGEVYEGQPKGGKADTTLTVSDSDMVDIAFGKLQAQAAYMRGKLKIKGNIMLTQKLVPLLKSGPKL